jgi:AraC-like DNA-binding protein
VTEVTAVAGISRPTSLGCSAIKLASCHTVICETRRLDRAERLIPGTQLPLAAIAATVGISDHSHLNRVTKIGLF